MEAIHPKINFSLSGLVQGWYQRHFRWSNCLFALLKRRWEAKEYQFYEVQATNSPILTESVITEHSKFWMLNMRIASPFFSAVWVLIVQSNAERGFKSCGNLSKNNEVKSWNGNKTVTLSSIQCSYGQSYEGIKTKEGVFYFLALPCFILRLYIRMVSFPIWSFSNACTWIFLCC